MNDTLDNSLDVLDDNVRALNDRAEEASVQIRKVEERLRGMNWKLSLWTEEDDRSYRGYILGWQKVGKNWRVCYHDARFVHEDTKPLTDASKLIRIECAPLLVKLVQLINARAIALRKDPDDV